MTSYDELLSGLRQYVDFTGCPGSDDLPEELNELLKTLVGDVQALVEVARRATQPAAGLSRVDALKAAREHVEAMSTNTRGYQDGVRLSDKVAAVETFARFLMGESE
ncbi:hypothetical protein [Streptomyces hydrogenans]|uniref:hypothetical protein n=1 Tax=Streptomyces hydrogenans TaxID=1873719 RepID=UPI0035DB6A26